MPENALYYSPDVDERARDQYQNSLLIPYLNQRPNMLQQAADYWGPQLEKSIGPGIAETLAQKRAGTYRVPTANELWEDPFLNALAPGNLGMAGMLVGPKSRLWKTAPQVADDIPQGAFSNLYDRKPMMEIADDMAELRFDALKLQQDGITDTAKLKDFFRHDKLYEAYPELKDIKVFVTTGDVPSGKTNLGSYGGGSIWIKHRISDDDAKQTLLHEIQHAIQEREGWARGGNPGEFIPNKSFENELSMIAEIKNDIANAKTPEQIEALKINWGLDPYKTLNRLQDKVSVLTKEGQMETYKRLFGEYMSRDTASRNALNQYQRTQTMPFSSEPGMTPDKMIYRYER